MEDPQFAQAFIGHLEKMIGELRTELAHYQDGSARAGRGVEGVWTDITDLRIAQIQREKAALENAIAKYGKDHA
jgi:hypothetical protein